MAEIHNRTRYLQGCRCDTCKAAQAAYMRERRQSKNASKAAPAPVLVSMPTTAPADIGSPSSVAASVERELDTLTTATSRPGLKAAALAMARVLDSPAALPQHPAAAGKLMDILAELSSGGTKKKTKLGELRKLNGGKSA